MKTIEISDEMYANLIELATLVTEFLLSLINKEPHK